MSIVNHFRNKILSAQRNIHIVQIVCKVPPKKGLFRAGMSTFFLPFYPCQLPKEEFTPVFCLLTGAVEKIKY